MEFHSSIIADESGYDNDQVQFDEISNKNSRIIKTKSTNVIKGQWNDQEDKLLVNLVTRHGPKKWSEIAKWINGRVGKQCRERWNNYLRPDIKKDSWTEEEDRMLIETHKEIGSKWSEIAKRLPGRSENTIKNHWNATKRRKYSRRMRDGSNATKGSLLHNYIKSVSSTTPATPNTSSAKNDNEDMMNEMSSPKISSNPHMVQFKNSDFNSTCWNIEAFSDHVHHQRQEQQQEMNFSFDANGYNHQRNQSCNASFISILGEDNNPMENFQLPLRKDSLRKEIDFLEMMMHKEKKGLSF